MGKPSDKPEPDVVELHIDNSRLQDIEPVYANYIQLIPTAHEVVLNFGRLDPPTIERDEIVESERLEIVAKPVARVVIPHSQFDAFAALVARQYAAFSQQVGAGKPEQQ